MNLNAKSIVITGASSGLGEATARLAAAQGAKVLLLARNKNRLQQLSEAIAAAGGTAYFYSIDLSNPYEITACATDITNRYGTPDILINNAGAGVWRSVLETSAEDLERIMAVPYFASFNLTREFLPGMIRRKQGHIVNVTSVASKLIWPGSAAYAATRWAMNGFNDALRTEVSDFGINVTLAMFGKISGEYWQHNPGSEERLPKITRWVPAISPTQAARALLNGIANNKAFVLKPHRLRLALLLNALFPGNTSYILRKTGWKAPASLYSDKPQS